MQKKRTSKSQLFKTNNPFESLIKGSLTNLFVVEAKKVQHILKETGLVIEGLLQLLMPLAKDFALPFISDYKVGAAGLGKSGNVYLGVNLEFPNLPLNQSVHGEQFLVANAKNHQDELISIALSAAPCGHCRQFLNELGDEACESLTILTPDSPPKKLSQLLPEAFGPKDLGFKGGLLTSNPTPFKSEHAEPLFARAIEAAYLSYAPYSKSLSGAAIKTKDGSIHKGSYLENAAFNPSLSPFHSALVALVSANRRYDEIQEVVLVEQHSAKISHAIMTQATLSIIAPKAKFYLEKVD